MRIWRPLAKKSTTNQRKEHNFEKYIQWVTTMSLTIIRVYLHSSSRCWLQNLRNTEKIFELIVGHYSSQKRVIQGYRSCCQSKVHVRLPISH